MIQISSQTPNILVIGDLIIDHYLWGSCNRISPEAPVQVVNIQKESMLLGGAGNVVNNLKSLDAKVDIISVIGECDVSSELRKMLLEIKIDIQNLVIQKDRISSKKTRIIAEQQQVIRYDQENTNEINNKSQNSIIKIFKRIVKNYDVILLSDYGKGVLTFNLTQALITISKSKGKRILVDPKGLNYSKYNGAYLLTPNKKEASEASKIKIVDETSLHQAIKKLKSQCNLEISLITLSEQGVAIFDKKFRTHPTVAREVFDVTGAGDTILASLGFALSCNNNIDDAVKFANLASGVVVGKIGSATASMSEIIEYESNLNSNNTNHYIKTISEINSIVKDYKKNNGNQKIVFTNGCFDLLHVGHIKYLEKAKNLGDILILGLNSDSSVERLKGKGRPITKQNDRAYILASLQIVDYLVIFEEDTPYELIKIIKPDILVKGGDYNGKDVVGQDIAKELVILDFITGKSTSKTIKRIKEI